LELDPSPDDPDMFGAREKWSEQSLERIRWVMPVIMAAIGVMGAAGFGLGFAGGDDPQPWPLTVLGWICVAWSAGWLLWAWVGGPMRVEVDQGLRSVKWIHARRFKPKMQSWRFDDIVELSVLMTADIITTKPTSGIGPSERKEYDTYWIVLHLHDGSSARLFGKFFDKFDSDPRARERLAKLVQLTGKPEKKFDAQRFEQVRAEVEAGLAKRPKRKRWF
jgi:hypothetical protein